MNSKGDKAANIADALKLLDKAASQGADVAVLPEYTEYMGDDAGALAAVETIPGATSDIFAAKAREHGMNVILGSIRGSVEGDSRCANTSLLFNRAGELVTQYRKIHLYDVDLPGRVYYKESDTVAEGNKIVTSEIDGVKVGMSICYDIRFPELFRLQTLAGARILFVPAAFTLFTGRDHWELLLRARAVENQCYVVAAGQVGSYLPGKACNGRSMIIDPWGTVMACASDTVGTAVADLDFDYQDKIRAELPALLNRRADVYALGSE
jgi:predicted amidohydrolase